MENLTLDDVTQESVRPHVQNTELLLARAASKVSGVERGAKVWGMPDLSMPRDISRILGGFFCGATYSWDSKEPMIPVDSGIQCCGVSMFKLGDSIAGYDQFAQRIRDAIKVSTEQSSYEWNFGNGNHFVIYGSSDGSGSLPQGNYGVLHSSATEFKKTHNGLSPVAWNWYSDKIETIEEESIGRRLRFIRGKTAERFIKVAQSLEAFNENRHRYFADLVFGADNIDEEVCNIQHYGMPTENSVAIGCQWARGKAVPLLTAPQKPIYLVRPKEGGPNDVQIQGQNVLLFPHGLGRRAADRTKIEYAPSGLLIDGKYYGAHESIRSENRLQFRNFELSEAEGGRLPPLIQQILDRCAGDVLAKIDQIHSYHFGNLVPEAK